jgi:hypothetical protein
MALRLACCLLVALLGCSENSAASDASISGDAVVLDCEGPSANPVGALRFSACQVSTTNGKPTASCNRDQTGQGTGALSLVLLDPPAVRIGETVPLDSTLVSMSGAFTTSAITASSVDGTAQGTVTFTLLDLGSPQRIEGAFNPGAGMRFRPDPPYLCALEGAFQAVGP